jgi:hypothetical protein
MFQKLNLFPYSGWKSREELVQLGVLERVNLNHWTWWRRLPLCNGPKWIHFAASSLETVNQSQGSVIKMSSFLWTELSRFLPRWEWKCPISETCCYVWNTRKWTSFRNPLILRTYIVIHCHLLSRFLTLKQEFKAGYAYFLFQLTLCLLVVLATVA